MSLHPDSPGSSSRGGGLANRGRPNTSPRQPIKTVSVVSVAPLPASMGEVADVLVVASVVAVLDEGSDHCLRFARHLIRDETDAPLPKFRRAVVFSCLLRLSVFRQAGKQGSFRTYRNSHSPDETECNACVGKAPS